MHGACRLCGGGTRGGPSPDATREEDEEEDEDEEEARALLPSVYFFGDERRMHSFVHLRTH